MTEKEWEQKIAEAWAVFDQWDDGEFVTMMESLCAEAPSEAAAASLFELGGTYDSTGDPESAVALYRQALAAGLAGTRRRRAVIQLASSLRNLGQTEDALGLLTEELNRGDQELEPEVRAFLALVLVDSDRGREAVAHALTALAPTLTRYQRSVTGYARLLVENETDPN